MTFSGTLAIAHTLGFDVLVRLLCRAFRHQGHGLSEGATSAYFTLQLFSSPALRLAWTSVVTKAAAEVSANKARPTCKSQMDRWADGPRGYGRTVRRHYDGRICGPSPGRLPRHAGCDAGNLHARLLGGLTLSALWGPAVRVCLGPYIPSRLSLCLRVCACQGLWLELAAAAHPARLGSYHVFALPVVDTYIHGIYIKVPMSDSKTARGPCMRRTWEFPSSLLFSAEIPRQAAAGPAVKNRHLFLLPTPTLTYTTYRHGSHHAWEGTKFPPATTPATGLDPSFQPVTACATPDSGRSLYFAHGWSLPSRLSPRGHLFARPVPPGRPLPQSFFLKQPPSRQTAGGKRGRAEPHPHQKKCSSACFLLTRLPESWAKWVEGRLLT